MSLFKTCSRHTFFMLAIIGILAFSRGANALTVSAAAASSGQINLNLTWPGSNIVGSVTANIADTNPETGISLAPPQGYMVANSDKRKWVNEAPKSPSYGETSVTVYRSLSSGGPWTRINGKRASTSVAPTLFHDTGLNPGTHYYYKIRVWWNYTSYSTGGKSGKTTDYYIDTYTQPSAVTNFSGTSNQAKSVPLSWNEVAGTTSYHIYRNGLAGAGGTFVAAPTTNSYTDTGLADGTTYSYVVYSCNASGCAGNSPSISATTMALPIAPADLLVSDGTSLDSIALNWSTVSGAASYRVYKGASSGGPFTLVSNPTEISYTDSGLENGVTYWYAVAAVNAAGEGPQSEAISGKTGSLPTQVTGLTASQGTVTDRIDLSWAAAVGSIGYQVYRSGTAGELGSIVGTVTGTAFQDSVATPDVYYYTVVAQNDLGNGVASDQAMGFANRAPTSASVSILVIAGQTSETVIPVADDPNPGDTFTFMIASQPANGTAAVFEGGLVYTPNDGYSGSDNFTFIATDAAGASVTGTADVVVEPPPARSAAGNPSCSKGERSSTGYRFCIGI